jgi:hypothetical protein
MDLAFVVWQNAPVLYDNCSGVPPGKRQASAGKSPLDAYIRFLIGKRFVYCNPYTYPS